MPYDDAMPPKLARRIDANATRHSADVGEPEPTDSWPPPDFAARRGDGAAFARVPEPGLAEYNSRHPE
eukprot:SAG22_NODE_5881_length_936_cov_2.185185_1_plen_67_part_10